MDALDATTPAPATVVKTEEPTVKVGFATIQIQPGEQTTEYAQTVAHNLKADTLKIISGASAIISATIDILGFLPQGHRTLQIVAVLGGALAGLAHASQLIATIKYTDGRSAVKVATSAIELLKEK